METIMNFLQQTGFSMIPEKLEDAGHDRHFPGAGVPGDRQKV